MIGDHRGVMAVLISGAKVCRFGHHNLLVLGGGLWRLQAFLGLCDGDRITIVRQSPDLPPKLARKIAEGSS